jgi:hypothetical protein
MPLMLPDFSEYAPDDALRIAGTKREVRVFNGKGKHTASSEHVIGLMHGLLGQGTVDYIAGHLAQQGHDVFTYDDNEWQPVRRSRNAHQSTVAAMKYFGRPTVEYKVHSDAVRAIVGSVLYQSTRDPDELIYEIAGVTTVDGNGTNGIPINFPELAKETGGWADLARKSPHRSAQVFGRSMVNFAKYPLASTLQTAWALRYDARPDALLIEEAGVPFSSVFHSRDFVVRSPGNGALEFEGSHLAAIIFPDTMIDLSSAA